ncbi:MAG TPA: MG2 domain-containing protein [Myxococcales bacterium]|nr:MG2 domain-containing protein [Myxococcales bacterium]
MNASRVRVITAGAVALGLAMSPVLSPRPRATPAQLGGPDRFLTALSTDKPLYHPGEVVYVRGVMLHAFRRTPAPPVQARVEIRGPRGEQLANASSAGQDGVWAFSWVVPADAAGGEYRVKVSYPFPGDPPAERAFDVRAFRAPRLKSQIVFLREGYGPGDTVTATLEALRAEGGAPAGAKVTATARVDGVEVARVPSTVDARGRCTVSFDLPRKIERGEGALAFAIEDGGVQETAAKSIPILLQTVDLAMYPEGGELVAGLKGRVYFEARTPAKKPADLEGDVIDQASGEVVGTFRSEHEGRGRFELAPQAGHTYAARIHSPAGIQRTFPLPAVAADGVVLRTPQDVFRAGEPLRVGVTGVGGAPYRVSVAQREVEVASGIASEPDGTLALDPGEAGGVLTVTVFDRRGTPLAERLVYRQPAHQLQVRLSADRKSYVPGGSAQLTVRTTQNGKPVSAVVALSVIDDSVLQLIDRREQPPSLPVMVLLEPEVKELADAQIYLDEQNPKAPLAVDLLLGTQGWRRFAMLDSERFVQEEHDDALRVLARRIPVQAPVAQLRPNWNQVPGLPPPQPGPRPDRPGMKQPAAPQRMEKPRPPAAQPPGMAQAPRKSSAAPPPQTLGTAQPPQKALGMVQPPPQAPRAEEKAEAPAQKKKAPRGEEKGDVLFPAPFRAMDGEARPQGGMADRQRLRDDGRGVNNRAPARPMPMPAPAPPPAYVRVYAHSVRPNREPEERTDFAETLYWSAGIRTDPQTGEAKVSFGLSDAVTAFRASAGAFSSSGALGSGEILIRSVEPFYLEPKLPLEVTAGDLVRLPVSLVNGTDQALGAARVQILTSRSLDALGFDGVQLGALGRVRRLIDVQVGNGNGTAKLTLDAKAGQFVDRVERTLEIRPPGFPVEIARSGVLSPQQAAKLELVIPPGVVPESLTAVASISPTPVANLTQALTRLIQEPSGCFEQASSTTYPMTMAQQYFLTHQGADPQLVQSARERLERGYQRLVGFECQQKGFEWFGQDPGHEALTAFGLLHFNDMAKVREVSPVMLASTQRWLLGQRDGKGGFERKRRALHTWIEDRDTSNAYILWALLETGARGLDREIAEVKRAAGQSANSYVVALGANALALAGDRQGARQLMARLAAKQDRNGQVNGGTQSIVGSGGEALLIETTSLSALAWLRDPEFSPQAQGAIRFITESSKSGRYGSTQSTVLALRAILAHDRAHPRGRSSASVRLLVDGEAVGDWTPIDPEAQDAVFLPDFASRLGAGTHLVRLEERGRGDLPYSISVRFNALTPPSSPQCQVSLQTSLAATAVAEGELVEATATVQNRGNEKLPTVVAVVGVPGGLEPRHDQLKELVKRGAIDSYEVRGREVVLYWRGMDAGAVAVVPISLVAAVPGRYTAPASRAYLYYTDEHKTWVPGLAAEVTAK